MPGFKRKVRKYAKKGFRYARNNPQTVAAQAKTALKMAKYIKRHINTEIKYHSIEGQTTLSTLGAVLPLHTIGQGDTSSLRDGSSIKPMRLSGYLRLLGSAPAGFDQQIRVAILRGKHEQGVAPTWATVYEPAGTMPLVFQPKLWNHRFNTKTLFDRKYILRQYVDTTTGDYPVSYVKINMKLYGHIQYTASANTADNGGLYLFMASDDAPATNNPVLGYSLRLTFTDN